MVQKNNIEDVGGKSRFSYRFGMRYREMGETFLAILVKGDARMRKEKASEKVNTLSCGLHDIVMTSYYPFLTFALI
jgi:hypothetical protein